MADKRKKHPFPDIYAPRNAQMKLVCPTDLCQYAPMHDMTLSDEQKKGIRAPSFRRKYFFNRSRREWKSTVVRHFISEINSKEFPVLASTGAGSGARWRPYVSQFFGLGIMEGDRKDIVTKATRNRRVVRRLQKIGRNHHR
ncbi:MAG: hypothetical protein R2827_06435 [Bdellovibrionales bacterium]